jgi:hypothetical protein
MSRGGGNIMMATADYRNYCEKQMVNYHFQTAPIKDHKAGWAGLTQVVSVIRAYFAEEENWTFTIPSSEGSVTFQHRRDPHLIVKVFIDHERELAKKYGLRLNGTPIVVGVELTHYSPYQRDLIRQDLCLQFTHYMNPANTVQPRPKTALMPQYEHRLDVIFIPEGNCCGYNVSPELLYNTWEIIRGSTGMDPSEPCPCETIMEADNLDTAGPGASRPA